MTSDSTIEHTKNKTKVLHFHINTKIKLKKDIANG